MSKFVVALISSALACVIGFLLGACLTVPQNKEMETLVNAKIELTQQIKVLQTEKDNLIQSNTQLKKEVALLKDRLLKAYEIEKETTRFK